MIERARQAKDMTEKSRLYSAAEQRLLAADLKIPLYQTYSTNIRHPSITGAADNRFRANAWNEA